jgi:hypothetical protein
MWYSQEYRFQKTLAQTAEQCEENPKKLSGLTRSPWWERFAALFE